MKRTALFVAIALSAMATSTGVALAEDAYVLRDSDVYANRTGNRVVNEVEEGDIVDVRECRGQRCRVRIPGEDGWVRANRLAEYDEDEDDYVPFRFGITIGGGGGGFSFGIN
jgi:SH3-like domain-containing protein